MATTNPTTETAEQNGVAAPTAPVATNGANGAQQQQQPVADGPNGPPVTMMPESRLPTRKDASLKEFLNKMDDYAPIVCFVPPCPLAPFFWGVVPSRIDEHDS